MKKYLLFIGIDISKKWIDVSLTIDGQKTHMKHRRFGNQTKSFAKMLQWIFSYAQAQQICDAQWLFCMEHTGIYTLPLTFFLEQNQLDYVTESALRINRSLGLNRAKNDKNDSKAIAKYAYLHVSDLKINNIASKTLLQLKDLMAFRDRLIKHGNAINVPVKEAKQVLGNDFLDDIEQDTKEIFELIKDKIRKVEKKIMSIIQADEQLQKIYDLATSIKGIGMICAVQLIIHTKAFTAFENHRKFACYISIAPFARQSGSSLNSKAKVSPLGHRKLKALLTNAAMSAIQYNKELKAYYHRRGEEGKNKFCVLNAVKNKLLSYVFATVNRGTPFVERFFYA